MTEHTPDSGDRQTESGQSEKGEQGTRGAPTFDGIAPQNEQHPQATKNNEYDSDDELCDASGLHSVPARYSRHSAPARTDGARCAY